MVGDAHPEDSTFMTPSLTYAYDNTPTTHRGLPQAPFLGTTTRSWQGGREHCIALLMPCFSLLD